MNILELYKRLEERIPSALSCEWDRDGLECCPDRDKDIKKVLIALDVTDRVIEKAVSEGFDLILAHHPLFFGGLKNISVCSADGARAVRLIRGDVGVMTFHTRLDAVDGGVNDTLCALLGLKNCETVENGDERIMRIGELDREMTAEELALLVKKRLNAPMVTLSDCGRPVRKVALLGGSGGDDLQLASLSGADAYITGELKYHEQLSYLDLGISLLCAGHFYTEYPVCFTLEKMIKEICPEMQTEVCFSNRIKVM